ncbi:MAG: hypothetical protein QXT26_08940 [Thermoproteota archaeon]
MNKEENLRIEFTCLWTLRKPSLATLLLGIGATPFGCFNQHENTIYVFLDQILQASVFSPNEPEEWVASAISRVVFHELLHVLEPNLNEDKVVWAEDAVFGALDIPEEPDWEEEWDE